MLWAKLSQSTENDYVDFKRQWYSGASARFDLIHDILCMCNSLTDSIERYIVIGVSENRETKEKTIHDVSNDANHRTQENITQTLRNHMPAIPHIEIVREPVGDKYIDIIKITPNVRDLPYVLHRTDNYQDENNRHHVLPIDWIFARDGSRNTGIGELCKKSVLEELFARKRGEHMPTNERFALYLDDLCGWERPKTSGVFSHDNLSEDAYYYTKNHKFKIVRGEVDDNCRYMQRREHVRCYEWLVGDTGLCKDYWDFRIRNHTCYDDFYEWFDVELVADGTIVDVLQIMKIHFKYYFFDNRINLPSDFYLPPKQYLAASGLRTKEQVKNSFIWKICKMLTHKDISRYVPDSHYDDLDNLLDYINWDYIQDVCLYRDANQEYMNQEPNDGHTS
ncbi:MAG: ATP-binding protein [Alphaproteobacteria bacterium]|nr:ATP-binding protein [Alphaproteobacteria bacterium]